MGVRSSLANNKFSCLTVDEMKEDTEETYEDSPKPRTTSHPCRRPRWEKQLPKAYKIAMTPGKRSLHIAVQVQMTDTGEIHGMEGLIDCGADGEFLDTGY